MSIDNATSVGDFQTILWRIHARMESIEDSVAMNDSGATQQLAAIRVDVRTLQQAPQHAPHGPAKFDLIDPTTMAPKSYSGSRSENYKVWAKSVKAYANAKLPGYRMALDAVDKLGKDTPVDHGVFQGWNWKDAVDANSKFYDMLLLITTGEAHGIVESVPGQGFEAWRLIGIRFNSVGSSTRWTR